MSEPKADWLHEILEKYFHDRWLANKEKFGTPATDEVKQRINNEAKSAIQAKLEETRIMAFNNGAKVGRAKAVAKVQRLVLEWQIEMNDDWIDFDTYCKPVVKQRINNKAKADILEHIAELKSQLAELEK